MLSPSTGSDTARHTWLDWKQPSATNNQPTTQGLQVLTNPSAPSSALWLYRYSNVSRQTQKQKRKRKQEIYTNSPQRSNTGQTS